MGEDTALSVLEIKLGLDLDSKSNKPVPTIGNFLTVMRQDKRYAGIRYNEMSASAEKHAVKNGEISITRWTDADDAGSRNYIEQAYQMYSKDKHQDALRLFFEESKYNPIRDIVDNIEWDGKNRCEHFLHTWAKVDDSKYSREVSRLIFAGGIHRLYAPGTKFDDVPILIGTKQGEGKSSLIRFLAINDQYYGECNTFDGQPAIEQLSGKWICEISEMLALTKSKEQEAVKAYLTRTVDTYRKPYDRSVTELPRRCVFIGTTNQSNPLVDKTGNRRFYPVEVHCSGYDLFDHEQECRDYIMQCWAEARERFHKGEMPNFADRKLADEYRERQEEAMQDDWRVGAIRDYLDEQKSGTMVCVRGIMRMCLSAESPRDPTLVESKDIGNILDKMRGWERCGVQRTPWGRQRCWKKVEEDDIIPFWDEE